MSVRLPVKVAPKAARNALTGWMGDTLKISVTTAPEKGKANQAVIGLLADALQLPKSALAVVRGQTSPQKLIEIHGLDEPEVWRRLGRASG